MEDRAHNGEATGVGYGVGYGVENAMENAMGNWTGKWSGKWMINGVENGGGKWTEGRNREMEWKIDRKSEQLRIGSGQRSSVLLMAPRTWAVSS